MGYDISLAERLLSRCPLTSAPRQSFPAQNPSRFSDAEAPGGKRHPDKAAGGAAAGRDPQRELSRRAPPLPLSLPPAGGTDLHLKPEPRAAGRRRPL